MIRLALSLVIIFIWWHMYHGIKDEFRQSRLDEFCWKLNQRTFGDRLFDRLVVATVCYRPNFQHRIYNSNNPLSCGSSFQLEVQLPRYNKCENSRLWQTKMIFCWKNCTIRRKYFEKWWLRTIFVVKLDFNTSPQEQSRWLKSLFCMTIKTFFAVHLQKKKNVCRRI